VESGGLPLASNRLLAALHERQISRLLPDLEPVALRLGDILYDTGGPITHVYFPVSGVVSVVAVIGDNEIYETATVGREGMTGLPAFLNGGPPTERAMVQVAGHGFRLPADRFCEHLRADPTLTGVLNSYTQMLIGQLARNVACNRAHNIRQRCARWLLMTADRMSSERFELKQEFLAQMIGVRRASVSEAAGTLADTNSIRYARGVITITDRAGLEQASCGCYQVLRELFHRQLSPPATSAAS
jgi:CRP-like cAMP-binding protein